MGPAADFEVDGGLNGKSLQNWNILVNSKSTTNISQMSIQLYHGMDPHI